MAQSLGSATQKDFRDDLVVNTAPSVISSDSDLNPVVVVGRGIERPNARQSVKTFTAYLNGITTTYWQAVTVQPNTRVFFLGVATPMLSTETLWIEDAASGNIVPSDSSTTGLFWGWLGQVGYLTYASPQPRECKMGIRIKGTNSAGTTTYITVYYLEERIDGQTESI